MIRILKWKLLISIKSFTSHHRPYYEGDFSTKHGAMYRQI